VIAAALGCATIRHTPVTGVETESGTRPPTAVTDPRFEYSREPIEADTRLIETAKTYEIFRVRFASVAEGDPEATPVTVDFHRATEAGSHPAVIVLPIWGRHVYPSNAVTRTLKKRSKGRIHILNVLGEEFLIGWPQLATITDETEFMATWSAGAEREIATLIDLRRLIDWAEDQPEIDATRIGLIGFSHGAMLAPTLAIQEPRISATVLVMGGAEPHEVIARCVGARTETIQHHARDAFGWSTDEMAARLEPVFRPVNAAEYLGRVDPRRVLIFESGRDECVPEIARDALWNAMGRPERYTIDASHRHSFYSMTPLRLNWMRKKIWRFFESRLLEPVAVTPR
jgi:dienelactone hydrolase